MLELYNKYSPKTFKDLDFKEKYKNCTDILKHLDINNIPNIIFSGSYGTGKKTILYSFLGHYKKTKYIETLKVNNINIDVILYKTPKYIEIDINTVGIYKQHVFQNIFKKITSYKNYDNNTKIIIIHNIHILDIKDQFILRKIIEENISTCRFILLGENINNLIEPIISRCLILRLEDLEVKDIKNKIDKVIKQENIKITPEEYDNIIQKSNLDLKKSLLELQTYTTCKKTNVDYNTFVVNDVSIVYNKLIENIEKKKCSHSIIDTLLYKLTVNYDQDGITIIKTIFKQLKHKLNIANKKYLIDMMYNYDKTMTDILPMSHLQSFSYEINHLLHS